MTLGGIIYKFFIGPLELFFEVVFVVANRMVDNPAYAIIMLSLAMNFLVLPLYRRADALQAEERDRENRLQPWIKHIRKTFKGDERFMMLQTYYRQNDYKPTDSLKGSISLLLEIPFFIAAYHFLSNLETLRGVPFGPIADLGAPDALITIGAVTLNFLPILMTLINVVSAAIYMKGFPLKSKIQMYGIAVIFLVFLYNSPAGLVFYWTLNNIFSLVKNVFYKLKNPGKVLAVMASAAGILMLAVVLFIHPMRSIRTQGMVVIALLMLQLPLIIMALKARGVKLSLPQTGDPNKLYYPSCILLAVLTGLLIPSAVIRGSAEEFISLTDYVSPMWYIVSAAVLAAGTFILWFGIFYGLASDSGKQMMSIILAIAAAAGLMDYMLFGKDYGNFSADLQFDMPPVITAKAILINAAAILAVAVIVCILWRVKSGLLNLIVVMSCVALIGMSCMNVIGINGELRAASDKIAAATGQDGGPQITLSKTGKNVIVVMMDRQIGYLFPFLINEDPELKEQFDGFTYYRNSVSFGCKTNFGSPALYGGYDYTPEKLNERDTEPLEDKHNEALKVMPELFGDEDYKVTIFEPTYAGYTWIPDISIFNDHPEYDVRLINHSFSLEEYGYEPDDSHSTESRYRNFFCYGLFKTAPALLQQTLYQHGNYNAQEKSNALYPQVRPNRSQAEGYMKDFMESYSVLCNLKNITKAEDTDENTFLMMSNDTTHDPQMLKEPEYVPALKVDNKKFDKEHKTRTDEEGNVLPVEDKKTLFHYQINMASMAQFGEWFDYMRENDVYDNTRIIIVSDHGHNILNHEKYKDAFKLNYTNKDGADSQLNILTFNSVLLVKDFDAKGFTIDDTLTTNADVPALATEDLIKDAKNPFTNNKLTTYQEKPVDIDMLLSEKWSVKNNNGNKFLPGEWFRLKGTDIYDVRNWEYIGWK